MPPTDPRSGLFDRAVPRRGVLLGGLGAAVTLIAACSSSADDSSSTAPNPSGPTASGPNPPGPFPVTVAGKEGPVTVRSAPKRIVAAGYLRDTDLALALGAPLVGAARNSVFSSGLAPWQKPTTSIELFDTADGLPYEQIAARRPDLILATDDYTLGTDYAKLAKIGPTLSYQHGVGADTWQTMTTRVGQASASPPRRPISSPRPRPRSRPRKSRARPSRARPSRSDRSASWTPSSPSTAPPMRARSSSPSSG